MKLLGLIGGTSWVSTGEYYRLLNEGVNRRLGDPQFARCLIFSFNYADILALNAKQDWDAIFELVAAACLHHRDAGAEGIVLCANTMHLIADRVQERVGLPVIHIADATAEAIRRAGLTTVALLGTRFTMEKEFFRERLASRGIEAVIPEEADREFIHTTIFGELGTGNFLPATKARYLSIIDDLAAKGAEGAILGCTEIPMLIKQSDCAIPLFDTTAIHVDAAIEFALGE
ncbi:aspartate/glutamate racemase family protein [Fimbriimonas ginsengisoli]|uniref:Aspartate racemase n=1 Tax=Fimbriimonas ginsengisoli Gsoil 348 TaxID=661478 RepID=A0A068NYQ7_FIMGI|nr:aspartate/glutamate racemase family protein [Fimbriimonas ginsengisoli]AIE87244.1 aspartate racemase [Fimbriimonas ginsengisoli Gsoil 348]